MAQRVVDRLETVEIDKQSSQRRALALCTANRTGEVLGKQAAVG